MTIRAMILTICFCFLSINTFAGQIFQNQYFIIYQHGPVMDLEGQKETPDSVRAQALWKTLNEAVTKLRIYLPDRLFARLTFPLSVKFDYDEGCNAAWDGESLLFFKGNEDCVSSALVPSMVVHELGHALADGLKPQGKVFATDLNEGLADIFAAVLLDDPIIGRHFNKHLKLDFIRDLTQNFSFPDGQRGNYSGALIFSTFAWEVYSLLLENYSKEEAKKYFLTSLWETVSELDDVPAPLIKNYSLKFAYELEHVLKIKGLGWMDELLQRHGLLKEYSVSNFVHTMFKTGIELSFPPLQNGKIKIKDKIFPLAKNQTKIFFTWEKLNSFGICGKEVILTPELISEYGAKRKFLSFNFTPGRHQSIEKRIIPLGQNVLIPDQGKISFPFELKLKQGESFMRLSWKGQVEHYYPEDLRVSFFVNGSLRGGFRGIEEVELSKNFDFTESVNGTKLVKGILEFQDVGPDFSGVIHSHSIEALIYKYNCEP